MNFLFSLYIQSKRSFYWTKSKIFFIFFEKLSFYVSEHEHAASFDVDVNLSAERYVAQSARVARGEYKFVKRVFEVLRIAHERAFAVGKYGYGFALLRGHIELALDVVDVQTVFFGFCAHTERVGKAHNREVAKNVVDSAARYAVKHERVGVVDLFCVVHGKFAVACVFVRIMLDEGNVDAFGI